MRTRKKFRNKLATPKLYMNASRSAATRRGYTADIEAFRQWGGRIPSTPNVVARYLAEHADTLAYATLSRRLAGISNAHQAKGVDQDEHEEIAARIGSGELIGLPVYAYVHSGIWLGTRSF